MVELKVLSLTLFAELYFIQLIYGNKFKQTIMNAFLKLPKPLESKLLIITDY